VFLLGAGCRGETLPEQAALPGTYLARQVQGQPMPVKLTAPEGCERMLMRSELVLRENGTFAGKFEIDKECAETSESDATFYDGSYTLERDRIHFLVSGSSGFEGVVSGPDILITMDGQEMIFRRQGYQDPAVTARRAARKRVNKATRETEAAQDAEERELGYLSNPVSEDASEPTVYSCEWDPYLDNPRPIPAADTAGLGAPIARSFPAYRLSTEEDIACRFDVNQFHPADLWKGWHSGRAYWIWTGDFDADGKPDKLVLLTRKSDPHQDLLVAFMGSGAALPVAGIGSWPVSVGKKGQRLEDEAGRKLLVPGNLIESSEEPDGICSLSFYWKGGKFHRHQVCADD
jgi:hypothetical protein